jgi:CRISPR/Cas system CSM-associated protein Csm4 (group 5 of RAMP superfamily)
MQYVKRKGSYWIKTNENTGWWIKFEGGYYATITNGSTSLLVPKYLIIDYIHQQNQQEQKQNHYHQHQQNQQNQKELQQQELQEQEFHHQQNQQIDGSGNSFTRNELERNEPQRERKSQVKCQKCGLEGSYVKRKVKSHYYLYIRHKTNGKIKECLISRLA